MALNLIAEIIIIGLHNQKQYHFPNVMFLREQGLYNLLKTEADLTVIFYFCVTTLSQLYQPCKLAAYFPFKLNCSFTVLSSRQV